MPRQRAILRLSSFLDRWRTKRGDRLLPSLSDMDMKQLGPLASHLFIFERCSKADWKVRFAGDATKSSLLRRASKRGHAFRTRQSPPRRPPEAPAPAVKSAEGRSRRPTSLPTSREEILAARAQHRRQTVKRGFGGLLRATLRAQAERVERSVRALRDSPDDLVVR